MEGSRINMLRRISTAVASVAMLGLCALPASASTAAAHSSTHNFTVPSASSAVKAWGSYTVINSDRIKVTICTDQVGPAFAVGAEAIGYRSNGQEAGAIAAVDLPQSPRKQCGSAYILFAVHLKVHTFIGSGGRIIKTSKVKEIF
jgi:hypothetical protein